MTREQVFHQYGIHDTRPGNILQHVLRRLDRATKSLQEFEFAEAQKQMAVAKVIARTLYPEL